MGPNKLLAYRESMPFWLKEMSVAPVSSGSSGCRMRQVAREREEVDKEVPSTQSAVPYSGILRLVWDIWDPLAGLGYLGRTSACS